MKRLSVVFAVFSIFILCAGMASAAGRKAPPLKEMGGQEVATAYFDLTIPNGWSMPVPPRDMPNAGMTVVFGSMSQDPAISISVMKTPMSAKEIGEATTANMKKGGMNVGPLEESDGLWTAAVTKGKSKGKAWFGANDGIAAVTIVTGNDVEKANEIFSVMRPKVKGLFPTVAN